jgi:hypothetical protein
MENEEFVHVLYDFRSVGATQSVKKGSFADKPCDLKI